VLRDELVYSEIDGRNPAVLVVDRANLDRERASVFAPLDATATAVLGTRNDANRALLGLAALGVFLVVFLVRVGYLCRSRTLDSGAVVRL